PPDNLPHQIRIRISKADTVEHSFALTIANTAIATISPANVTIPIGSTEAIATITGRAIGQTSLTLTSSTLGTLVAPVFITTEFSGLNTSYSTLVGVVLEQAPTPPSSTNITPLVSSNVGVVVGNHIAAINPNTLTVGTGPVSLVITGAGLQDVTSVQFNPSDGLSLGAFSANPDGQSLVIPVTVAANAPTTQREVVVLAGTVRYPAISPTAGRVKVVLPPPEVHSLDPMFATPGTSGLVLTVRGRYLSDLQSVTVSPADGVSVGAASVNADGTVVTVGLEISASTIPGQRVITVTTLGGTSSAVASSANTFAIVASSQIRDFVAPITAPIVGVVLEQEAQPPVQQSLSLAAASVGVTLGSVVTGINPMAGSIGETVALTVTGNELQGVSEVRLVPNSGVTVSSPTVAEDGKSLTVNITIALDAPQTLRTLQVVKAATVLPAAPISATQFRVTTPQPEIHAVSPLFLQVGQTPASLSIHGKNFQNLQQIRVLPANDVSIGAPSISSDGISITVNVAATAGATLGPRVVIVETAAGSTSTTGTIANTITLTNTAGTTYAPIAAPLVGVLLEQSPSPPISTDIGPITAANVGVMLEQAPLPPVPTSMFLPSSVVGVTIGSVATQIQPTGAIAGSSITLLVRGLELNQITGIAFNPSAGVVIGTVQVNGDGTELTVPLDVTVNAASGWREVILNTPSGAITFVDPAQGRFYVAAGAPIFSSISPIFGTQGGVVNLTINGQNLNSAIAMTAVPSEGISFGNAITVNATGTQLNVQMQISASAPTTARAIRVTTPAAISSEVATPVNTFTVFPP
ncbi:MAG TPA: hypothetical protein VJS66_09330, partial [Burkholderiales bacterium]|nr:hypothetical protein [Burkholderiales bacterium]